MHFYQPADPQPCYYCKIIEEYEDDYPIREGIFTTEQIIFRCAWHSKFKCSSCGKYFHFSWLYYCPQTKQLTCGFCNPPTLKPVKFWNKTYAYDFWCKNCEESHYDLFFTEYKGQHPWQLQQDEIGCTIEEPELWNPFWKPLYSRKGKEISLEEALKIEDRITPLRKRQGLNFHSEVIPEKQVDVTDTTEKWETDSQIWMDMYFKGDEADEGDTNRQLVIDPALWELIGDVKGLKVLDAGCGNGYLTRKLAKAGAKAVGIDFSHTFIEYCKKREDDEKLGCEYYKASLTNLEMIKNNQFDLIVSNIVMVDISDYKQAFKELSRVLKTGKRFVWSNTHPIFGRLSSADLRLPRDTPRNEERYFKVIDNYLESGGRLVSWRDLQPLWQFDRTLTEYSHALKEAGFAILEIVEPKADLKTVQENPRFLAFTDNRYPFFIIYDCIKT